MLFSTQTLTAASPRDDPQEVVSYCELHFWAMLNALALNMEKEKWIATGMQVELVSMIKFIFAYEN